MEGLVPRFELDTPRVNSEAPIGLIKKTSTTTGSRHADRVKTLLLFGGASSSVHIPFRGGRLVLCGSIPVSFLFFSNHGILVLVSFYEYWHRTVAGLLSPTQRMILDCCSLSHPMIPYGVVLCPPA